MKEEAKALSKSLWSAIKRAPGHVSGKHARGAAKEMHIAEGKALAGKATAAKRKAVEQAAETHEKLVKQRRLARLIALPTAGVGAMGAGVGLGRIGRKKEKEKKSMDEVIMDRANEILEAAVEVVEDYEKTSADEEALNAAALEVLDAHGYDTDLIVELLTE